MATFPTDAADQRDLIIAADRACYAAKRAGRDRIATAQEGLAFAGRPESGAPEASVIGHDPSNTGDLALAGTGTRTRGGTTA